jgi:hypothetical protein
MARGREPGEDARAEPGRPPAERGITRSSSSRSAVCLDRGPGYRGWTHAPGAVAP